MNIIRGDTLTIAVPIMDKNKKPIDISDITELYLTCRVAPEKDSTIIFQKEKSDFRFENNKYKVDILPEDTQELNFEGKSKKYHFDIEVTVEGMRKSKIDYLTVEKDYTIHTGGDNIGN